MTNVSLMFFGFGIIISDLIVQAIQRDDDNKTRDIVLITIGVLALIINQLFVLN